MKQMLKLIFLVTLIAMLVAPDPDSTNASTDAEVDFNLGDIQEGQEIIYVPEDLERQEIENDKGLCEKIKEKANSVCHVTGKAVTCAAKASWTCTKATSKVVCKILKCTGYTLLYGTLCTCAAVSVCCSDGNNRVHSIV